MKQLFILWVMLLATSVQASEVRVLFKGQRPDTIVVNEELLVDYAKKISSLEWRRVPVAESELLLNFDDDEVVVVTLWPLDEDTNMARFILAPGDSGTVEVTDSNFKKVKLGETDFFAQLNDFQDAFDLFYGNLQNEVADRDERIIAIYNFYRDYTMNHKDEDISVYTLSRMPLAMAETIVDSISERVATGMLQVWYDVINERVKGFRKQQANKKNLDAGGEAPDFTLCDLNGQKVSLSDFKGRWVLIDFWATWCKWCIKGFPALKEFERKNGDKCVVLTLCTDQHEEIWRDYMEEHPGDVPGITLWVDPREKGDANPMNSYVVKSFPTKFLISPEGKVRLTCVGERADFLSEVEKIIDKQ